MRRVVRWTAVLLVFGALAPAGAGAQAFSPRFTVNEPGAIWVTGSTLMTCPAGAPNCAASQAGTATGAALNNNGFVMTMVDTDADAATFNSSSSTFAPPAAHEVLFAGLYFGGRVTAGAGGGTAAPNAAARGNALLQTPAGGSYVPVTGTVVDSAGIAGAYVAFADVTALVRAGGAGRYAVANVQSGTGMDRFAGWSLVVVYRDPAQPLRNLTVFDGLAVIEQGDPPLSIGVSGFRTPLAGPVRTSVGLVAYEGDRGSAGDRLALDGQLLSDAANPATNLFNSSVSFEGTNTISQRIPAFINGLGFDADRIVADGFLANGATSATFAASTTLDQYMIQVVTFTTDLSAPRLEVAKSATDLDGGEVDPGDTLRYTMTTTNTGDDAATGVVLQDPVPAGTTPAGAYTGSFDVGTLAAGASTSVSFDVVVGGGLPDGFTITNVATASGVGATAGRPVNASSAPVTSTVRRPALDGSVTVTPSAPVAGQPAEVGVTVTDHLSRPIEDVVVTIDVPGATVLSTPGNCTVGDVVRCPVGTLDPSEQATVRVRIRPHDSGTLRPVVSVEGEGVAARALSVPAVRVKAGRARLSVSKRAVASFARPGRTVAYRIVVAAARTAATARGVTVCDEPSAGLRLRTASRGGVLRNGRACWRLGKLAPGRSRTLRVTARVTASSGAVRNVARARATNLRARASVADAARLRVAPAAPSACAARRMC